MFIEKPATKYSIALRGKPFGVGINDADYMVRVNGEICPYYQRWTGMLERCYSEKYQQRFPTYKGCFVCVEWLVFSNFKSWMKSKDWVGNQLDRDLAVSGNKVYSPLTCIFITDSINKLLNKNISKKGNYPTGVSFHKRQKKFQASCNHQAKKIYLGAFDTIVEAENCYIDFKSDLIKNLANKQDEPLKSYLMRISKEYKL